MTRLFIMDYSGSSDEEILLAFQCRFISSKRAVELEGLGANVNYQSELKRNYTGMLDDRLKERIKEKLGAELMIAAAMRSMGLEYTPPKYERTESGMPWCDEAFFSVSHTQNIVCSVIGNTPVGVDVEFKRTVKSGIARKILSESEQAEYACSKSKNDFLLRHWTAKESCLKLRGRGIETNMRLLSLDETYSVTVERSSDGAVKGIIHSVIMDSEELKEMGFNICDCFIAVSGVERESIKIQVFNGFNELTGFLDGRIENSTEIHKHKPNIARSIGSA